MSEAERRVESEALQALKALQSVTTAGVPYNEYSRRVLDAKVQVDKYTQKEGGDEKIKGDMLYVMTLYVFARDAWSAKIADDEIEYIGLDGRPEVDLCPQLKDGLEDWVREKGYGSMRKGHVRGLYIAYGQPQLWRCASERIAEIDQALKRRS